MKTRENCIETVYELYVCTEYHNASVLELAVSDRRRYFFGMAADGKVWIWGLSFRHSDLAWCFYGLDLHGPFSDFRACGFGTLGK